VLAINGRTLDLWRDYLERRLGGSAARGDRSLFRIRPSSTMPQWSASTMRCCGI